MPSPSPSPPVSASASALTSTSTSTPVPTASSLTISRFTARSTSPAATFAHGPKREAGRPTVRSVDVEPSASSSRGSSPQPGPGFFCGSFPPLALWCLLSVGGLVALQLPSPSAMTGAASPRAAAVLPPKNDASKAENAPLPAPPLFEGVPTGTSLPSQPRAAREQSDVSDAPLTSAELQECLSLAWRPQRRSRPVLAERLGRRLIALPKLTNLAARCANFFSLFSLASGFWSIFEKSSMNCLKWNKNYGGGSKINSCPPYVGPCDSPSPDVANLVCVGADADYYYYWMKDICAVVAQVTKNKLHIASEKCDRVALYTKQKAIDFISNIFFPTTPAPSTSTLASTTTSTAVETFKPTTTTKKMTTTIFNGIFSTTNRIANTTIQANTENAPQHDAIEKLRLANMMVFVGLFVIFLSLSMLTVYLYVNSRQREKNKRASRTKYEVVQMDE
eukprot:GHVT01088482.1.p1 GENE.GHVT01088482.1~~GHVT01088482.1.p1  ORF type:complete len:449 (+),score=78.50 GHVT01088482.1:177-1523(+)